MNVSEVNQKIKEIKRITPNLLTNCFESLNSPKFALSDFYCSEKTVLFISREYKVNRLIFYTADICDLKENVFPMLPKGEYCIDILTKEARETEARFKEIDLIPKSRMMRLATNDVSRALEKTSKTAEYFNPDIGELPDKKDAPKILELIWEVFDTDISHLPDLAGVENAIDREEFTWFNENGKISLLQTVIKPKSLYINQIYNPNDKSVIHAMLLNRINKYCGGGGKYMYAWVEESNAPSMKFHAKYQMKHDGLWNIIFKVVI